MPIAIEFKSVSKTFNLNKEPALDDVSFQIEEGEFITVLGSSGSGKTTTLRMMNRLIEPDSGHIEFYGQNIGKIDAIQLRRQMGYVVQQIGLFPHMTVAENIATVPNLLKWPQAKTLARTEELLRLVKLPPEDYLKRRPSELSGGQQQRIGVARALAADPPIMLLDEPFGAVDAITRLDLQAEIQKIHRKLTNKTFVFVTHDINEAFKLGDRVMIMDHGRICQFATPQEIIRQPQAGFVQKLIDTVKEQKALWGEFK